ncbi:MAG: MFS transporter [Pauljensenia sp.]
MNAPPKNQVATVPSDTGPVASAERRDAPNAWTYTTFVIANIGLCIVYGAILQVLLGVQVDAMVPLSERVAQLAIVTSVSAISATLSQPINGWIADRAQLPLGKRNSWILIGAVALFVTLFFIGRSSSVWALTAAWSVGVWFTNMMQVNLSAFIPERTPLERRGVMSGVLNASRYGSMTIGVWIAGLVNNVRITYVVIGVICLATAALYCLTTKDTSVRVERPAEPAASVPRAPRGRDPLFTREAHDFWMAWLSRFCVVGSYFLVIGYLLYIMQDYVGYGDGSIQAATIGVSLVATIVTIGNVFFAIGGGWLADRTGRIKAFVVCAALLFVAPAVIMSVAPGQTAMLISGLLIGIGFGVYNGVDQALVSLVLPSKENAGRDLGVINLADAGPQIIAPSVAALLITITGTYASLFVAMGVICALGALAVSRVRSVR